MIKFNEKHEELTLVAVADPKELKYVSQADCSTTLISEEKKIYMVIKKDGKDLFAKLRKAFKKFVASNKLNVNVDLDSFIEVVAAECGCKAKTISDIYESISFESFKKVCYKKCECKTDVVYNLITKEEVLPLIEKEEIKMEFVNFARTLQDTPPNIATSEYLADEIAKKAKTIDGLKVTVLGRKEAEDLGMGLFLGVNAGSCYEPRAVVLEYIGDESQPKVALVGKGITFDSGGYNLKPSNFMDGMKFDMSGAAIMLSTVMALAKAKAKINIVGVGMFTDNRIGKTATLPESVLTSMNGLTVEIGNTDAEGRLVLADGITYAIREKQATEIWEASTLTGAMTIALGSWATGVFTNFDQKWKTLKEVSEKTGERMWRMPIFEEHVEKVKNDTIMADLTNSCKGREGGSSTAAAFLNEFAENKPFVHFDIAGTADIEGRGQGVLVRTLFEMFNK
ncbi:Leucyl aminopeptidase [Mycoplasma yeatsii 13926]|uniref:Probable cytosol aminopeptidase n=1 Tax=Mycoplasma yeatsii 13926 TaxID=1188240 RepID=S6G8U4_9MOLU|nr:M17 family metallopeptidase [Mycoplasma yeatsii]EOA07255.1 Leucyl aminopeptidase [Mycoplasma yeatsii 13926]